MSPAEIAKHIDELQQKNPYAGRANASTVGDFLTDEVRWQPRHPVTGAPQTTAFRGKQNLPRAAQTRIGGLLTDEMPEGAGQAPPAGFYYNMNGQLQHSPSHPAMEDHMIPSYFGALDASEQPEPPPNVGRAHFEGSSAQRTLADALIFGRQNGSQAKAQANLDAMIMRPDRRRPGPADVQFGDEVGAHLAWEDSEDLRRGGSIGEQILGYSPQHINEHSHYYGGADVGGGYAHDVGRGAASEVPEAAAAAGFVAAPRTNKQSMRSSFSDSSLLPRLLPVRFDTLTKPMHEPGGGASWLSLERQPSDRRLYAHHEYGLRAPRPLRDARGRPLRFGRPQWDVPPLTGLRHPREWVPPDLTAGWYPPQTNPSQSQINQGEKRLPAAPWELFGYRRMYQ